MIPDNDKYVTDNQNQSIIFNVGLMFAIAYSVYFFLFPALYFGFEDEFIVTDLIRALYTDKGLWFLTYKSMFYSISGLLFFLVGYTYFFKTDKLISKPLSFFEKKIPFGNLLLSAVILFSGGILSKILGILKGAHLHSHYWSAISSNQIINFLLFFNVLQILSLIILYYGYLVAKREHNLFWKRLFGLTTLVIFTTMILATFIHGSKALTLGVIFPMLVLYSHAFSFKKSIIIFFLMGFSVLLVMFGKTFVESSLISNGSESYSPMQSMVEGFVGRVNQTHITTEIFTRQDDHIGLKIFGEFYEHTKPVKERKNIIQNGNQFAQDFGFINIKDNATGVGRTVIGGLYIAFGFVGIILGMLFLGSLYKMIFWLNTTDFGIIFYSFTLLNLLLRIEQDIFYVILTIIFHFSIVFSVYIAAMKGGIMDMFFGVLKKYLKIR